jgi:hypothetical protein
MNGTKALYKTTLFGLYDRATSFDNQPPFDLPKRYADGKNKLDPRHAVRLCLRTTM